MNFEHSLYSVLTSRKGNILSIKELILNKSSVQNLDIFRVKESKTSIVVSERLKNEIVRLESTGIDFIEIGTI